MKTFKVTNITLPENVGYEHIHIEIEDLETKAKENLSIHITDLETEEEMLDEVKDFLKKEANAQGVKTRKEFKDKILGIQKAE